VSQGCVHCYAETVAARFSKPGQAYEGLTDKHGRWNGKIMVVEKHMLDPIRWREPRKIFVNSMSDLFHENLADDVIDDVFAVMAAAWHHTFQVLTKRPARMLAYMTSTSNGAKRQMHVQSSLNQLQHRNPKRELRPYVPWPLPNVWLGTSTEDQATLDERVQQLLWTPAAVRWISAEPLLGPLNLAGYDDGTWWNDPGNETNHRLDWVVVGGESGPGHRPMDPQWAESIAEQCRDGDVALFVKQDSGSKPGKQGRLSDDLWAFKDFPNVVAA
jgi:protein gp37